jgi:lipoprotein NlpD
MKSLVVTVARRPALYGLLGLAVATLMSACASPSHRAPVEDRRTPSKLSTPVPVQPAVETPKQPTLPGAENAGKPGYYTIRSGDTLIRIGLDNGQNWRDIARWNSIENPNLIEVGQVLRVLPPGAEPGPASARPVAPSGRVETKPLDGGTSASTATAAAAASAAVPGSTPAPTVTPAVAPNVTANPASAGPASPAAASREPDEDISWAWPAAGPVAAGFDEARSKGLAITGKLGDPVLAAADGRVVYAGSGLRGYGNLVIVKHNATYLTAYAHNQSLLVKEDQAVRRGQRIAEMGSSDAERVQLHFEIRRQGKPIDPARLLPPR